MARARVAAVSIRIALPPPVITPALLTHQPPSGWTQACRPSATGSSRPVRRARLGALIVLPPVAASPVIACSVVAGPAADVDGLGGDRRGRLGGQVADQAGDFLRGGVPADRDLRLELGPDLLLGDAEMLGVAAADPPGQRGFH